MWFERWNALTDAPETHEALAALYAPDGLHLTGPDADQRGTATFRGPDGVRALAGRIAATTEKRTWRIDTDTAREATAQLLHVTTGPWGGPAVAVQFVAVHTDRATQKRYATPGAAFFQIDGGKFRRVRIYLGEGERAEVEAEPRAADRKALGALRAASGAGRRAPGCGGEVGDDLEQPRDVDRLGEVVLIAGGQRPTPILVARERGQRDRRQHVGAGSRARERAGSGRSRPRAACRCR